MMTSGVGNLMDPSMFNCKKFTHMERVAHEWLEKKTLLVIWLDGLALMSSKGSADVAWDDEYDIVG